MLLEAPLKWPDYELIDSGDFEKLERFGKYILIRPEPKALWSRGFSEQEWVKMAHACFKTGAGSGKPGREDSGSWVELKKMTGQWVVSYRSNGLDMNLRLGLTAFKHIGVFPEQAPNWDFIYNETKKLSKREPRTESPKVLNLFAYTGAASLAAKAAGADVTHLDSVRQVVTWARKNMELSRLDNIRWVVEDAVKFVKREAKRGNVYQGVVMDPPAYGRGPDGEMWKLDELLFGLVKEVSKILSPTGSFFVLNLYSNGYSALLSESVVKSALGLYGKSAQPFELSYGELFLRDRFKRDLPLSVFTRLTK